MKTITKTFNLYEFKELNIIAQELAIYNHITFELETMNEDSWLYHCVIEMEKMQTPWFTSTCIYEKQKDDIIKIIEDNNYLFFKDGELIPTDYYEGE
jgi:hypothetical protein